MKPASTGLWTKLPDGARLRIYSQADPSNEEFTDEEVAFMKAFERYKRENRRPFPTCRELLAVVKALGYQKGNSHGEPEAQEGRQAHPDRGL